MEKLEARRKLQKWEKHVFSYLAKIRISSKFSTIQLRDEQGCMEFWTLQVMRGTTWTKTITNTKILATQNSKFLFLWCIPNFASHWRWRFADKQIGKTICKRVESGPEILNNANFHNLIIIHWLKIPVIVWIDHHTFGLPALKRTILCHLARSKSSSQHFSLKSDFPHDDVG